MTTPERPYLPRRENETDAEYFDRQQKEVQAAAGEAEVRDSGSANAQNTPGPETQTDR